MTGPFVVDPPIRGYQCGGCGWISSNPDDMKESYCTYCHVFGDGETVILNWDDPWKPGEHPVLRTATWGCSTISHARLGWCASCLKVTPAAELMAWRLHAMGSVVPGYRGAVAFSGKAK